MPTFYDRVQVSTTTTGTGTISLGSAVRSATNGDYLTFAEAGVPDGAAVRYVIIDGNNWASGTGVYTASGTTLSRDASERSWNGTTLSTAALSLSGSAKVMITALAADIPGIDATGTIRFAYNTTTTGMASGPGIGNWYGSGAIFNSNTLIATFGGSWNWSSGIPMSWNSDVGLSRLSAGVLALGNGTQGSFSGGMKLTTLEFADGTTMTTAPSGMGVGLSIALAQNAISM